MGNSVGISAAANAGITLETLAKAARKKEETKVIIKLQSSISISLLTFYINTELHCDELQQEKLIKKRFVSIFIAFLLQFYKNLVHNA